MTPTYRKHEAEPQEGLFLLPWQDEEFRGLAKRWQRCEPLAGCLITSWLQAKGVGMAEVVEMLLHVEAGLPEEGERFATPEGTAEALREIDEEVRAETNPTEAYALGASALLGLCANFLEQLRHGRCTAPRACAALLAGAIDAHCG